MRTALADPEDDEPGRDNEWYKITYFEESTSGQCRVCHTAWGGGSTVEIMGRVILCGLGHVLAGRRYES
jgi:hypothetical protein